MVRRRSIALFVVALCLLAGCKRAEIHTLEFTEEEPAPTEVSLTRLPALGLRQSTIIQLETIYSDGKKILRMIPSESEIVDVTGNTYTERMSSQEATILRNDTGQDIEQHRAALGNRTTLYTADKRGNFVSQTGEPSIPIDHNYPNHPVKVGDTWEGTRGIGAAKQPIHFRIEKLFRWKGHAIAVLAYTFVNERGSTVQAHWWIDTTTAELIEVVESSTESENGISFQSIAELHDLKYSE